jgi:hypothetical protein
MEFICFAEHLVRSPFSNMADDASDARIEPCKKDPPARRETSAASSSILEEKVASCRGPNDTQQ